VATYQRMDLADAQNLLDTYNHDEL